MLLCEFTQTVKCFFKSFLGGLTKQFDIFPTILEVDLHKQLSGFFLSLFLGGLTKQFDIFTTILRVDLHKQFGVLRLLLGGFKQAVRCLPFGT